MALSTLVIFGIVLCLTQPVTIIANLLTIIAFTKVPSLQTHTSNLLIFALSITDFIFGIYQFLYFGIPFAFELKHPLGEIGCMLIAPFEYAYNVGNLFLVAISIDRILLVSMDYSKYVKLMTTLRIKVVIGICVLICLVAMAFELSMWNYAKRNNDNAASINFNETCLFPPRRMPWFGTYVTICFFFLPLILVSIFSIIFVKRLVVRLGRNKRVAPDSSTQSTDDSGPNNASRNQDETGSCPPPAATEKDASKKRYIKAAVTLAALVSAMCISMLPYCTYITVVAVAGSYSPIVSLLMYFMLLLNPLLDPLFFAATQKGIREYYGGKIRGMVRSFCSRN